MNTARQAINNAASNLGIESQRLRSITDTRLYPHSALAPLRPVYDRRWLWSARRGSYPNSCAKSAA